MQFPIALLFGLTIFTTALKVWLQNASNSH